VSICLRVSILQGVKISIFPIGNWRRRYNSAALPRRLWYVWFAYFSVTTDKVCKSVRLN